MLSLAAGVVRQRMSREYTRGIKVRRSRTAMICACMKAACNCMH